MIRRFLMSSKTSFSLVFVLCGLTFLSFLSLTSPTSHADTTVSANASVNVAEACTLTSSLDTPHTATINPGTYKSDGIGQTTLSATCNDSLGYAIYAVGYTGEKIGDTNSTKLVGQTSNLAIESRSTNPTSGNSNWLMKLTATGTNAPTLDNGYNDFSIVPLTYVKVAHKDSSTGSTASTLTTTYAAYISSSQAADTYMGKVKYTMVHPATGTTPNEPQTCPSLKICYYPNGEGKTEGTMGQQNISTSATGAILLPSNFSRAGYGFAGWSDAFDYESNPNAHFYGPQETIPLNVSDYKSPNNGLSLYAMWIKSEGNFQDSAKVTSICNRLTTATSVGANLTSVSALTDIRDNETYAIAKLADGKCWMIENLRLESTNGDNSIGAMAQGYGGQFIGLADIESPWDQNTPNSLYTTQNNINGKITVSGGLQIPHYNNINTSARASNPSNDNNAMYSYGNYYSWAAAVADTTNHTIDEQSVTTTSLCPANWHLPTGGRAYASDSTSGINVTGDTTTYRDFYYLGYMIMDEVRTAYEDNTSSFTSSTINNAGKNALQAFRSFPNNFLLAGSIQAGSIQSRGSSGRYWSSTTMLTGGYSFGHELNILSGTLAPGTSGTYKQYGKPIRCLTEV